MDPWVDIYAHETLLNGQTLDAHIMEKVKFQVLFWQEIVLSNCAK